MAGSLDDVKRRILARVPLAELIGERVKLTLRSGRPVGCCPFHAEKSPSFYIYDDRYHCFGCKMGGDAIEYVRKTEGLSYPEALRYLAGKYSVEAPELDEARSRIHQHRTDSSLYKMMTDAQEFYVAGLQSPDGDAARAYLERRGFTPENIEAFGFGVTPLEGFGLVKHLRTKGHREQDMVECSLATASTRDGRPYDFLRSRLTIPIRDPQGRLIAFGGRSLGDEQPKYKNSGNTKLFDKSHTLYGFDQARRVMRERGRGIVVEGYMDALQLWQQGFPEAVACLGTAFTEGHLRQLRHATGQVILLFDGDSAGQRATLGAINVALTAPEVQMRAVTLPHDQDPDDFVRQHGKDALEALLHKAEPLLDFVIRERLQSTDALSIPDLISKEFIPWLAKIPDRMQRDFLVHKIAHRTGVPMDRLTGQLDAGGVPPSPKMLRASGTLRGGNIEPDHVPMKPLTPALFDLIGHIYWSQPGEIDMTALKTTISNDMELEPELTELVLEMADVLERGIAPGSRTSGDWSSGLAPDIGALIARLIAAEDGFSCSDRPVRVEKVLAYMRLAKTKAMVTVLKAQIARLASSPEHAEEVSQLLKTVRELSSQRG